MLKMDLFQKETKKDEDGLEQLLEELIEDACITTSSRTFKEILVEHGTKEIAYIRRNTALYPNEFTKRTRLKNKIMQLISVQ